MWFCERCGKSFARRDSLTRHLKTHEGIKISCDDCPKSFSRRDSLEKHILQFHKIIIREDDDDTTLRKQLHYSVEAVHNTEGNSSVQDIEREDDIFHLNQLDQFENQDAKHCNENTPPSSICSKSTDVVESPSAHNEKVTSIYFENISNLTDYSSFFCSIKTQLLQKLTDLKSNHQLKFNIKLEAKYSIPQIENSTKGWTFNTAKTNIVGSTIETILDEKFKYFLKEVENKFKNNEYCLEKIDSLFLSIYHKFPIVSSSYIPLPRDISKKKGVINPQNNDEQCFKWAILVKHYTGTHKYRVGKRLKMYEDIYNFSGIKFPTPLSDVSVFEDNNSNVSINVYGIKLSENKKEDIHTIFPLKTVDQEKTDHFDLLLLKDNNKLHYTYISNLSRLISTKKKKFGNPVKKLKKNKKIEK